MVASHHLCGERVPGQTVPTYVINLDRRPDRWQTISEHLHRIGVAVERIPAVDAHTLCSETRNCHPLFGELDLGATACAPSHGLAMHALLRSGAPAALILEDDAQVVQDAALLLNSVDWWPDHAKLLRLEAANHGLLLHRRPSGQTPNGRALHRLYGSVTGSAAYLINRAGAEIARPAFQAATLPADFLLFNLKISRIARQLKAIQVIPAMAQQAEPLLKSDIEPWRKRRRSPLAYRFLSLPYRVGLRFGLSTSRVRRFDLTYQEMAK